MRTLRQREDGVWYEDKTERQYNDNYDKITKEADAYEKLISDAVFGQSMASFVREDEVREAWRIVTPLLHQTETGLFVFSGLRIWMMVKWAL